MDSRGVTPLVEKLVGAGLVVLFVGGATSTLLAGIVPEYRAVAGEEVAERALAGAADDLEAAVVSASGTGRRTVDLDLPPTIAGHGYEVVIRGDRLRIDHPEHTVEATTALTFPSWVAAVESRVGPGRDPAVVVRHGRDEVRVELTEGAP